MVYANIFFPLLGLKLSLGFWSFNKEPIKVVNFFYLITTQFTTFYICILFSFCIIIEYLLIKFDNLL